MVRLSLWAALSFLRPRFLSVNRSANRKGSQPFFPPLHFFFCGAWERLTFLDFFLLGKPHDFAQREFAFSSPLKSPICMVATATFFQLCCPPLFPLSYIPSKKIDPSPLYLLSFSERGSTLPFLGLSLASRRRGVHCSSPVGALCPHLYIRLETFLLDEGVVNPTFSPFSHNLWHRTPPAFPYHQDRDLPPKTPCQTGLRCSSSLTSSPPRKQIYPLPVTLRLVP